LSCAAPEFEIDFSFGGLAIGVATLPEGNGGNDNFGSVILVLESSFSCFGLIFYNYCTYLLLGFTLDYLTSLLYLLAAAVFPSEMS